MFTLVVEFYESALVMAELSPRRHFINLPLDAHDLAGFSGLQ